MDEWNADEAVDDGEEQVDISHSTNARGLKRQSGPSTSVVEVMPLEKRACVNPPTEHTTTLLASNFKSVEQLQSRLMKWTRVNRQGFSTLPADPQTGVGDEVNDAFINISSV